MSDKTTNNGRTQRRSLNEEVERLHDVLDGLSDKEVRTLLKLLRTVDGNLRGAAARAGDKDVAEAI